MRSAFLHNAAHVSIVLLPPPIIISRQFWNQLRFRSRFNKISLLFKPVKSVATSKRSTRLLAGHVERLRACRLCPQMHKPVVSGGAIASKIILVGQAPGDKEPVLGRPFAWTAGKTLFGWFHQAAGMSEQTFRSLYLPLAAVCRCFPGKKATGGDRVPSPAEIRNCSACSCKREIEILEPQLVLPVGKLAIEQFMPLQKLDAIIGRTFRTTYAGHEFDLIPLPHPSGASPWHRIEPGKTLLRHAVKLNRHSTPAFQQVVDLSEPLRYQSKFDSYLRGLFKIIRANWRNSRLPSSLEFQISLELAELDVWSFIPSSGPAKLN